MGDTRTYDVNRDLWVWSRGGKAFFLTSLDPHGPFGAYLHILLRVARRQDGANQLILGWHQWYDLGNTSCLRL